MGKLAERYGDAARSGLYGVRDAGVPRAAAFEAGAVLMEIAPARLAEGWETLERALAAERVRTCVVLVAEGTALADPGQQAGLDRLAAAARLRREAGPPVFAVVVDPDGRLGLPPLYHEKGG